jgi:predicted amidohydrolase
LRLAVAQIRPSVGHVECNLDKHLMLIALASHLEARIIVFPELSLTGYEPSRAKEFERNPHDECFETLQHACNHHGAVIGVGVPLQTSVRPCIATLLFRPYSGPLIYSKEHLHPDEEPYFTKGSNPSNLIHSDPPIALAICFELSVPQHALRAHESGAAAYIASVAKTASGVASAGIRLSDIATEFSIPVAMANCLGVLDGAECRGRSSAWNRNGDLIAQLDEEHEGVLVMDTESCDVVTSSLAQDSH